MRSASPWPLLLTVLSLLSPLSARAHPSEPKPVHPRVLSGGKLQLSFAPWASEPEREELRVKEVWEALPFLQSSASAPRTARLRLLPVTTGPVGASPDACEDGGERHLREEFESRFGPSLVPLPDCLESSPLVMALRRSHAYMGEGVREAARELFSSRLFLASITFSVGMYFAAWLVPEPLFSKAFAAMLTVRLALAVGVVEVSRVAVTLVRLYQETHSARSMAEVEAAAEHLGKAMGGSALRALMLVASYGLGKALPKVPEGGLWGLPGLGPPRYAVAGGLSMGGSTTVQVMADGSLITTGALAGVAAATLGAACGDGSQPKEGYQWHHIATNKNDVSPAQGGPWTPQFANLFARAGMDLDAPENRIYLSGHKGPHSAEYHSAVSRKLTEALVGCDTLERCRGKLVSALRDLAEDICTPESWLNGLATKR